MHFDLHLIQKPTSWPYLYIYLKIKKEICEWKTFSKTWRKKPTLNSKINFDLILQIIFCHHARSISTETPSFARSLGCECRTKLFRFLLQSICSNIDRYFLKNIIHIVLRLIFDIFNTVYFNSFRQFRWSIFKNSIQSKWHFILWTQS